jgi:type I restriction-modification system DNA methylase subunit
MGNGNGKSLESWIWDAACSIRGAKDAAKFKEFILPLIFTKRLCDVFDDEVNRIAEEVGSRAKAFKLIKHDKKLVRFYLPLEPKNPDDAVWSVIRTLSDKIGEQLTTHLRAIADANPLLKGIIDRVDFNATTHSQRAIDDDRLSNLIEEISAKRLGLKDVEADIIGRSYEYLISAIPTAAKKAVARGGTYVFEWHPYDDYTQSVDLPKWLSDPSPGYVMPLSANSIVYDFINNTAHKKIGSWIDAAATQAVR